MSESSSFNEAQALHRSGRLDAAERAYRQVLQVDPNHSPALHGLGSLLYQAGRFPEAAVLLEQAAQAAPRSALTLGLLSAAQAAAGEVESALQTAERAVALSPDDAGLRDLAGQLATQGGHRERAVTHLRHAAQLAPAEATVQHNLAIALHSAGQLNEAIQHYTESDSLQPGNAQLYFNLALARHATGDAERAVDELERCLAIQPDHVEALYRLAYLYRLLCDWDGEQRVRPQLQSVLQRHLQDRGAALIWPYAFNAMDLPDLHDPCARYFSLQIEQRVQAANSAPFVHTAQEKEKLTVGLVSADLRAHAVGGLVYQLPALFNRDDFTVNTYSLLNSEDEFQAAIRAGSDSFRDLTPMGDAEAAEIIHADGVDVLFDLTGYTEHGRPDILARRPAPVQVSWLGYLNTMQADFIDYAIADDVVVTEEMETRYREAIVRMPGCFFPGSMLPVADAPSRDELGLDDNAFVFCSFNHTYKIDPAVFDSWMNILKRMPGSQLWLYAGGLPAAEQRLRVQAEQAGLDAQRLVSAPRVSIAEHVARLSCADLFLDTFHYNAGATAMAAAQAGLPILTLTGERWLNRMTTSINRQLGLDELSCDNVEHYVDTAVALATDSTLFENVVARARDGSSGPLFDLQGFTRQLEIACRQMWRRYQAGESPASFRVRP